MFLRIFVIDDGIAELVVAAGFFAGDANDGKDGFGFAENRVHFFEGTVGGFGVEEVDDGEDEGVAGKGVSDLFSRSLLIKEARNRWG